MPILIVAKAQSIHSKPLGVFSITQSSAPVRPFSFNVSTPFVSYGYKMIFKPDNVRMRFRCIAVCIGLAICASVVGDVSLNAQQRTSLDDQYTLAAGHYARGQWDQAEAAFTQLLIDNPGTPQAAAAAFFLPESQMQLGKFNKAFLAFQSFLKNHPQHPYQARAMFRMGESAFRTSKHDIAVRLLEEFVKSNPQHELNEFALPYLGQLRNLRNEPQLAQIAFETSLRLFPSGSLANRSRLGLAKALQDQSQKTGNIAEAKRFYDFLIDQRDPAIAAEARVQLAIMDFDRFDLEAAENGFREVIKSTTNGAIRAKSTYWLARIEIEQENYDSALQMLIPIANKELEESLRTAIWFDGAVAAVRANQDSLALDWLMRIRKSYPNNNRTSVAIRLEVDLLRKQGRLDEAIALARTYQLEDKIAAVELFSLETQARQKYENGEYDMAIRDFDQLIEKVGQTTDRSQELQSANWQFLKALAQIGNGDFDSAQVTLNQIDSKIGDEKLRGMIDLALGTCQFALKRYARAAQSYQRYLAGAVDPTELKRVQIELAICQAKLGQVSASDQSLERVFSDDASLIESDEIAIEILIEAAIADDAPMVKKWVQYLVKHGSNATRASRLQLQLAFAESGNPNQIVSVDSFLTLLRHRSQSPDRELGFDRSAIAQTAIAHANQLESRDLVGAKSIYQCVIEESIRESTTNIARLRLARILQSEGGRKQLVAAEKHLRDFVKTAKADDQSKLFLDEALYQLGWLAHDLDDKTQSESHFQVLVENHPDSKYWSDAAYRVMQRRVSASDSQGAKTMIEAIVDHQRKETDVPDEVLARVRFTQANLAVAEKDWETVATAMRDLEKTSLGDELAAQRDYWLAESNYQQNETKEALSRFEILANNGSLAAKHRPWVQLRIAQIYAQRNDWIAAESRCADGLDKYPRFSFSYEFHFLIARALERRGLLDDAKQEYQNVIQSPTGGSSETAAMAQWRIGESLFHQERYAEAIGEYYKVHSLYNYPKWQSAALVQAGKCQEMLNRPSKAELLYRRLLSDFPTTIYAREAQTRLANIQSNDLKSPRRTANRSTERSGKQPAP